MSTKLNNLSVPAPLLQHHQPLPVAMDGKHFFGPHFGVLSMQSTLSPNVLLLDTPFLLSNLLPLYLVLFITPAATLAKSLSFPHST